MMEKMVLFDFDWKFVLRAGAGICVVPSVDGEAVYLLEGRVFEGDWWDGKA